jgi:NAD(P)-dependent dehydrogenase (short-subunit alcohol dehydrogenase family)
VRNVVVTGASTGIGEATARVLARAGIRVFGSVRKPVDAERLAKELGPLFVPLIFDVTDQIAIDSAAADVERTLGGQTLSGLVNNAGVAVVGPLLHLPTESLAHQLDINIVGQLRVTRAFLPLLGADSARTGAPGRIVMMSSVAGRNASPFMGPYNASKFGLEGLAECLRRELMLFGIDVVIVAPGPIATPIWDKVDAIDDAAFADSPYAQAMAIAKEVIARGRQGFAAERVGGLVLHALTTRKPKTYYVITPHPWQTRLMKWLPKRFVDRMIATRLGLTKS